MPRNPAVCPLVVQHKKGERRRLTERRQTTGDPSKKGKESPACHPVPVSNQNISDTSSSPRSREFHHLDTTAYPSDDSNHLADENSDSDSRIGKDGHGYGLERTPKCTATDTEWLCWWCSWSWTAAAGFAVTRRTARLQSHAQQPNTGPPKLSKVGGRCA